MNFRDFFDKLGWAAMTGVALYAAAQIKEMNQSVSNLNINVAVLVQRLASSEEQQKRIDARQEKLEERLTTIEKRF